MASHRDGVVQIGRLQHAAVSHVAFALWCRSVAVRHVAACLVASVMFVSEAVQSVRLQYVAVSHVAVCLVVSGICRQSRSVSQLPLDMLPSVSWRHSCLYQKLYRLEGCNMLPPAMLPSEAVASDDCGTRSRHQQP